jgi:hypothetical protein
LRIFPEANCDDQPKVIVPNIEELWFLAQSHTAAAATVTTASTTSTTNPAGSTATPPKETKISNKSLFHLTACHQGSWPAT